MRDWEPIGAGGESGYTAGDPLNPGIIFGGTGHALQPRDEHADAQARLRRRSPETARATGRSRSCSRRRDPNSLYYANQFVFKTTDGAQTWTQISPRPHATRSGRSSDARRDRRGAHGSQRKARRRFTRSRRRRCRRRSIWIGTDDGLIQVTTDDGKTWQNVTPPAITAWSRVTMIEASHFDAEYRVRERRSPSASGLRSVHLSHARHGQDVAEDHERTAGRRLCPRGEGRSDAPADCCSREPSAARSSRSTTATAGSRSQLNLPVTSVRDFEIYENDLIVATHGRGFWVIDDISPLRQINDDGARVGCVSVQAGGCDQLSSRAATTGRRSRRTSRRRRIRRTARRSTTT